MRVRIVKVSGTERRGQLAEFLQAGIEGAWMFSLERGDEKEEPATGDQIEEWLASSGMFEEDALVVLETNELFEGLGTALRIFVLDRPFDELEPHLREAARGSDLVIVEWGEPFEGTPEQGLETELKENTGASKVLSFRSGDERERAYAKARDMAVSRMGGDDRRRPHRSGRGGEGGGRRGQDLLRGCARTRRAAGSPHRDGRARPGPREDQDHPLRAGLLLTFIRLTEPRSARKNA
jgi:hypothetical protein